MPYVHVRVKGNLAREQKEKISMEISETLERVAGKPKSSTYVVIEEVKAENWAVGGKLLG